MRVLVVSEPGLNGVFRYVEALCHYLIWQNVEVHLAYSNVRRSESLTDLVAFIANQGGETLNLNVSNQPCFEDVRAFFRLRRMAQRLRPDVIHSHSSKAGALARGLALLGQPALQIYHPNAYKGMGPERARSDVIYDVVESALGRIGHTINVSTGEQLHARDRLWLSLKKSHLIPNGVDTTRFAPPMGDERTRLRDRFNLPRDALVIGTLGRYSSQKDPLTLYQAFAANAAENPSLYLFHVGAGELEPEIIAYIESARISSRVVRMPYLATPADFYKVVDGFMLTSLYEGFSLAILEALSANLPLILSRAAGNTDFANYNLSHLWYAECRDVAGFSQALAAWSLRQDKNEVPNHREVAISRFENSKLFGAVLELYKSLSGQSIKREVSLAKAVAESSSEF